MINPDTLIAQHVDRKSVITEEIAQLNHQVSALGDQLLNDLKQYYQASPNTAFEYEQLKPLLNREQILDLVKQISRSRPLTPKELSDDVLFAVECVSYKNDDPSVGEALFASLPNDRERLRFALFCGGMAAIHNAVPSALAFVTERLGIETTYSDKANYLQFDGYNGELHESGLKLTTTRGHYEGLDRIAASLLKLLAMGYRQRQVSVFESSLSIHGIYYLNVIEREGSDAEFDFHLTRSTYGHTTVRHKGKGDTNEARLIDVLCYVADHHWYNDPNQED